MKKEKIIEAFVFLGHSLAEIPENIVEDAYRKNAWFTPDFIRLAANNFSFALSKEKIELWLKDKLTGDFSKSCGIIMAGNIPFVGLHDLLSVLACGHKAQVKLSSQDEVLIKYAIDMLMQNLKHIGSVIECDTQMKNIDYLIATGSNNSSRYFEYYFRNTPSLIRKNRTSIAVLSGIESEESLGSLADDIFQFFGLGCRNVSHLLLPRNIKLETLYKALDKYIDIIHHHKYYNNYIYHKSIFLMNLDKHYDNGFMLFRETEQLHASLATLNYHYYDSLDDVRRYIEINKEKIQCVVSEIPEIENRIPFGSTQRPDLWDYADNVNTLQFL